MWSSSLTLQTGRSCIEATCGSQQMLLGTLRNTVLQTGKVEMVCFGVLGTTD